MALVLGRIVRVFSISVLHGALPLGSETARKVILCEDDVIFLYTISSTIRDLAKGVHESIEVRL
jgi:hypothetical protein